MLGALGAGRTKVQVTCGGSSGGGRMSYCCATGGGCGAEALWYWTRMWGQGYGIKRKWGVGEAMGRSKVTAMGNAGSEADSGCEALRSQMQG